MDTSSDQCYLHREADRRGEVQGALPVHSRPGRPGRHRDHEAGQAGPKLIPIRTDSASLIGALQGKIKIKEDILSTGCVGMLNLDTHILLHAVAGRLTPRELVALREERWSISAIVLWEIAKLAQLGRIEVDLDDPDVVRTLAAVAVLPITAEIARESTRLDVTATPPTS